jgi:uncharacterized membrane protein HdeD (DUF308 family)
MSLSLDSAELDRSAVSAIRVALGVGGVVALIIGFIIVFQPEAAAATVVVLLSIYFLISGLVHIGIGIFSKGVSGGSRALQIILGVLFLIGAGFALANLADATAFAAGLFGIVLGILWIVAGIFTFVQLGDAPSRVWAIIFAILAILGGIVLLFAPVWGVQVLFVLSGIALIILGVVQIVRAFTFGRGATV